MIIAGRKGTMIFRVIRGRNNSSRTFNSVHCQAMRRGITKEAERGRRKGGTEESQSSLDRGSTLSQGRSKHNLITRYSWRLKCNSRFNWFSYEILSAIIACSWPAIRSNYGELQLTITQSNWRSNQLLQSLLLIYNKIKFPRTLL